MTYSMVSERDAPVELVRTFDQPGKKNSYRAKVNHSDLSYGQKRNLGISLVTVRC